MAKLISHPFQGRPDNVGRPDYTQDVQTVLIEESCRSSGRVIYSLIGWLNLLYLSLENIAIGEVNSLEGEVLPFLDVLAAAVIELDPIKRVGTGGSIAVSRTLPPVNDGWVGPLENAQKGSARHDCSFVDK
jgi:hypothetical protein